MKRLMEDMARREVRKRRVRRRLFGTADRPRLTVFRSNKNIYAQIIDDTAGRTIVAASSMDKAVRGELTYGGNKAAAAVVGKKLAEIAIRAGIRKVVFDRNGYAYHGRVKQLAAAAREGGLEF
ncbi:MAG: 50S ribosomal protein L18 [Phycisphaerae bacterium SM23_33]|nr:MAG: 50S ribosomal protein L18 [Phycisphaerae bacterium SM23_33]